MKLTFEFETEEEAEFAKRLEPFDGLKKEVILNDEREVRRACITLSRAQSSIERAIKQQENLVVK